MTVSLNVHVLRGGQGTKKTEKTETAYQGGPWRKGKNKYRRFIWTVWQCKDKEEKGSSLWRVK